MATFSSDEFVNREEELKHIKDKIVRLARGDPFAPKERVFHLVGPSGIGKSCLLEECYQFVNSLPQSIPILIKSYPLRKKDGEFIENFLLAVCEEFYKNQKKIVLNKSGRTLLKFGADITKRINEYAEEHVVVLLLDEMDIHQKEVLQSIEEHLLENLLENSKRVMLITAGREPAALNVFSLRPGPENIFKLAVFDEKNTTRQLEKLNPKLVRIAGKIRKLGGGVPGNNKRLAGLVSGEPLDILDDLQAIQFLLIDIKQKIEKPFHFVVEAICILSDFHPEDVAPLLENHPALGGQWDEIRIREVFTNLRQARIGPGGLINWDKEKRSWVMEEPTRKIFELELQLQDVNLWKQLHCTAYQMYQKWGEELNSQLYRQKAIYHRQCLQSMGYDCLNLQARDDQ